MPQWRKDPVVERWVVIATERAKRPSDFKIQKDEKKNGICPLCPGNEHETPQETLAFREVGSNNNGTGWWLRVIPNKFPAVSAAAGAEIRNDGPYKMMDGAGLHEVVVENSEHETAMQNMGEVQIQEVLYAWQERLNSLRMDARIKYIQIFKNYGLAAGASLEHPHSQVMAIPMVPAHYIEKINGFKIYESSTQRCIMCDIIDHEMSQKERIIVQNQSFICLAPYASRVPFEMMIIPRQHLNDFGSLSKLEIKHLAGMLDISLKKLSLALSDPPFNICLYTIPVNAGEDNKLFHWHLEILPKLNIAAGFELGTGFYINPTSPEYAARTLRETEMVFMYEELNKKYKHREVTNSV